MNNEDTGRKGWMICGQFNAKNSYGAYVGFAPFSAVQDPDGRMHTIKDPDVLSVWMNTPFACKKPIKKLQ